MECKGGQKNDAYMCVYSVGVVRYHFGFGGTASEVQFPEGQELCDVLP